MANKSDLISKVKDEVGLNDKDATAAVNTVFKSIIDYIDEDENVVVQEFGTFGSRERAERDGRNPSTGKPIKIKGGKVPKFHFSKSVKERIMGN